MRKDVSLRVSDPSSAGVAMCESHHYRTMQGRIVGMSNEISQDPESPIITSSPPNSRAVFRASRIQSF